MYLALRNMNINECEWLHSRNFLVTYFSDNHLIHPKLSSFSEGPSASRQRSFVILSIVLALIIGD